MTILERHVEVTHSQMHVVTMRTDLWLRDIRTSKPGVEFNFFLNWRFLSSAIWTVLFWN